MSKMTDEQIIKALECCGKNVLYENCGDCPYEKDFGKDHICTIKVSKDALDLINRQQAEIESLERRLHNAQLHQKETHKALQDERALRLKEDFIRAEAIKEFAEKVKANKGKLFNYIFSSNGFDEQIDNLVKEMVGEGK